MKKKTSVKKDFTVLKGLFRGMFGIDIPEIKELEKDLKKQKKL